MLRDDFVIRCLFVLSLIGGLPLYAEELPNTLGWEWRVSPHVPASFFASRGFLLISEENVDGAFSVTLARRIGGEAYHGLQIVAFDEQKRPFRLVPRDGGGQNGVSMQRWILPKEALPAS